MAKKTEQPQQKQVKVTLTKSATGYEHSQGETVRALGLRKLHHSVVLQDIPSVRGMIYKVRHLVTVEEMG